MKISKQLYSVWVMGAIVALTFGGAAAASADDQPFSGNNPEAARLNQADADWHRQHDLWNKQHPGKRNPQNYAQQHALFHRRLESQYQAYLKSHTPQQNSRSDYDKRHAAWESRARSWHTYHDQWAQKHPGQRNQKLYQAELNKLNSEEPKK